MKVDQKGILITSLRSFNLLRGHGSSPSSLSSLKAFKMASHLLFLFATSLTSFFISCASFPMYCNVENKH